ncbi:ATP-binding protein [Streptomyces sp. NPDC006733]|uniref:ATP-binding protein n=1 Tax=Streptomyces sp. NPDC006733 TaxID=3155460 RepID=UPI0033FEEFE1
MRVQVLLAVIAAGHDASTAESAQLVLSELVANVVRLCGPWAPVVVQVTSGATGVLVKVHDPLGETIPGETAPPLDNAEAESGRGLWIVDLLCPGWIVERTPLGKQIVCTVPCAGPTPA